MSKAVNGTGELRARLEKARMAFAKAAIDYYRAVVADTASTRRNATLMSATTHVNTLVNVECLVKEIEAVMKSAVSDHSNQATMVGTGKRRHADGTIR